MSSGGHKVEERDTDTAEQRGPGESCPQWGWGGPAASPPPSTIRPVLQVRGGRLSDPIRDSNWALGARTRLPWGIAGKKPVSGAAPVRAPPPRAGENREPGWSQAPRPQAPHSPARPRRIPPFLPPPHACPHGRVHPLTSRRQPRLRHPGHRRDGPDTEVAGFAESGAWATACRSSPVLRTVGRSLPPCPAPPCCSQGAPCAEVPSGNGRCPALLKRRPHRPGHSPGGKDASLHPSFHFPISLSLSPWAPSPSSLLSLPRKTGVLGRRLRGGDTALCLFLGWEPGSGGRPSLPRWRLLSVSKPRTSCLSHRASEKGSAGPLEWKPLHGSLRWGRGLAARSRGWQGRRDPRLLLAIISVVAHQSLLE